MVSPKKVEPQAKKIGKLKKKLKLLMLKNSTLTVRNKQFALTVTELKEKLCSAESKHVALSAQLCQLTREKNVYKEKFTKLFTLLPVVSGTLSKAYEVLSETLTGIPDSLDLSFNPHILLNTYDTESHHDRDLNHLVNLPQPEDSNDAVNIVSSEINVDVEEAKYERFQQKEYAFSNLSSVSEKSSSCNDEKEVYCECESTSGDRSSKEFEQIVEAQVRVIPANELRESPIKEHISRHSVEGTLRSKSQYSVAVSISETISPTALKEMCETSTLPPPSVHLPEEDLEKTPQPFSNVFPRRRKPSAEPVASVSSTVGDLILENSLKEKNTEDSLYTNCTLKLEGNQEPSGTPVIEGANNASCLYSKSRDCNTPPKSTDCSYSTLDISDRSRIASTPRPPSRNIQPKRPRNSSHETSTYNGSYSKTQPRRSPRNISPPKKKANRGSPKVTTNITLTSSIAQSNGSTINSTREGRRNKKAVTYKEPPLNKKMRRN